MTISSALSNALSGLSATARGSEVVASNIANAGTAGYARRTLEVSSNTGATSGGVSVTGVTRHVDPVVLGARREAQADMGHAKVVNDFLTRLETTMGTPDDPQALTNRIADFDASLLSASSRPDANERLEAALLAAQDVVDVINSTSDEITQMRSEADTAIDAQVTRLNSALKEVEELNQRISKMVIRGKDDSSLQDLRQKLIDEINDIAPVRTAPRDNGQVALYSTGGIILLDGSAREIEFSPVNLVTPYMSIEAGHLSGLSVDGISLRLGSSNADLPGGTLAAQFEVRDELGPDAMRQIDAAARDLVERFQDPSVDPTLGVGDAGLFTDGGLAFDPADEVGLAERLTLNPLADPSQGGEAWRLRDGLGAATSGAVGQSAIIDSLRGALAAERVPASGNFGTGSMALSDLANGLLSRVGVQRLTAENSLSYANASFQEMAQVERAGGVDTDAELQRMILLEQTYAANARMIQTIEDMLDSLMRI